MRAQLAFFIACLCSSFAHAQSCVDVGTLTEDRSAPWSFHSIEQETGSLFLPKMKIAVLEESLDNVVDFARIDEILNLLKDVYYSHGYFKVDLKPCFIVHSSKKRELDLVIKTELGERADIREILFHGLKSFTPQEIESVMQSQRPTALAQFFVTMGYGALQLEEDKKRIVEFYESQGFLDAKIKNVHVQTSDDLAFCDLEIEIEEGNRYLVGNIEPIDPRRPSSLKTGDSFDLPKLTDEVEKWLLPIKDLGFPFAKATPELVLNKDSLSARYLVDKGPRVIVGSVVARGNDYSQSETITRDFADLEGKPYNYSQSEIRRLRLLDKGAFSDAKITLVPTDIEGVQDLVVRVTEKFPMRFNASPYYLSGEGLILSAYAYHQNLFGHGVYGLVATQISSLRQTFELAFFDPSVSNKNLSWLTEIHDRQYEYESFASTSLGGGGRIGFKLSDNVALTSGFGIEEVTVDPSVDRAFLLPYVTLPSRSARGVAYIATTVEPLAPSLDTNQLLAIDARLAYAGPATLSELNFAEAALALRWSFSMWSFVLRGRLSGASLFPIADQKIALSDRYFLGGHSSLRGYQIFSVGPWYVGDANTPIVQIGGVRKFLASIEFEFPIMKFLEMRGYLFSDAGNAYAEYSGFLDGGIAASFGFGFTATAWLLPIKCEIAVPLVNLPGALGIDFYIGLAAINL